MTFRAIQFTAACLVSLTLTLHFYLAGQRKHYGKGLVWFVDEVILKVMER